jgi:[acyl-carrier-protein] S-malonyltransferase
MIVIAAPGQGSQKPGFLTPWLELPGARDTLAAWSDAIDVDLITHGTISDQDTIRDTQIAQPLIVASGLLTGRLVQKTLGDGVTVSYAGHSVGEFTAAALSGALSDEDALALVAVRGRAMAHAAAKEDTGMSAVIGGEYDEVATELTSRGLVPANVNGGGQVVAAGLKSALAELAENPPAGTRVIPLDVAGAFHTHFMESAVETLKEAASDVAFYSPHSPLYTNRDGSLVSDGDSIRELLIGQVSSPVRWDLCMEGMAKNGVTRLIELAPAGALVGLAKRALKEVETVKIDLPEHIESLTI